MLRTTRNRSGRAVGIAAAAGMIVAAVAGTALADNVSAPAIRAVKGLNTGLGDPIAVTRDGAGRSYVTDFSADSVSVFAPNATGDVAPVRILKGATTTLDGPESMAVDDNGFLYVANVVTSSVLEFSPGASGNVAPANSFGTGGGTFALTLDDSGQIYVGNGAGIVKVFGPNASGAGPTPLRTITGASTQLTNVLGLFVDDASGRLWAANGAGDSVLAFAPTATGDQAPTRLIKGDQTGLDEPRGVTVDSAGRIYVTNAGSNTVSVFAPSANGNVAPLRTISGVATGLSQPWGIALGSGNVISVVNRSTDALATYGPLFAAAKPGKPNDLGVSGATGGKQRTISWGEPTSDGGADITDYKVVVKKSGKTLINKTVDGSKLELVVKKKQLAGGVDKVSVSAINSKGAGPAVTRSFPVKK
jgi:sugar lactone lactonase YvrE